MKKSTGPVMGVLYAGTVLTPDYLYYSLPMSKIKEYLHEITEEHEEGRKLIDSFSPEEWKEIYRRVLMDMEDTLKDGITDVMKEVVGERKEANRLKLTFKNPWYIDENGNRYTRVSNGKASGRSSCHCCHEVIGKDYWFADVKDLTRYYHMECVEHN